VGVTGFDRSKFQFASPNWIVFALDKALDPAIYTTCTMALAQKPIIDRAAKHYNLTGVAIYCGMKYAMGHSTRFARPQFYELPEPSVFITKFTNVHFLIHTSRKFVSPHQGRGLSTWFIFAIV
jgi:hypothetical protein